MFGDAKIACFISAFVTTVMMMAAVRAFVTGRPLVASPLLEVAIYAGVGALNALIAVLVFGRIKHRLPGTKSKKPAGPPSNGVKRKTR